MKYTIAIIFAILIIATLVSCSSNKRKLVNPEKSTHYGYSKFGKKILYNYKTEVKYGFMWGEAVHQWIDVPADVKTFEVLGSRIAKDKDHIYMGARKLDFVDYKSFKYNKGAYYDKNHAYKYAFVDDELHSPTLKIIDGVDAETYEALGTDVYKSNTPFAKDKNHIYFNDTILKDVDYKTFKVVCYEMYADKDFIYIEGKKFPNKNHSTKGFKYVTYNNFYSPKYYYIYNNQGEHKLQEFPINDVSTVRGFNKNQKFFTIDGDVYYNCQKIENADAETFKVYDQFADYASDKNHFFVDGKIIPNVNPAELKYRKKSLPQIWYRGQIWDEFEKCFREPNKYEK